MKKRGLLLVALIIGLALLIFGCAEYQPIVNKQLQSSGKEVLELENIAYIPVKGDAVLGATGRLLRDIDEWIKTHPQFVVTSVSVVNGTLEKIGSARAYGMSGAIITFKRTSVP